MVLRRPCCWRAPAWMSRLLRSASAWWAGAPRRIEQDGFKFDTGPTFFLYPRVLREIFADAGYDLDREVPMKRLDPQYRLVFGAGGELLATPDVERMERAIAAISPGDAGRLP